MKIAIAGDSAGQALAQILYEYLQKQNNIEVRTLSSTENSTQEFYADMADRVCKEISSGRCDRAILICGTGIGVCIAANKVPGIRAALTHDSYSAVKASTSNNAQVITMGARVIGPEVAKEIVQAWINSVFDPKGQSAKNVVALDNVDSKYKLM